MSVTSAGSSSKTFKDETSSSELCDLLDSVRVTSPSEESEDSGSRSKLRNDSGCSYELENQARKVVSSSGHSTDSGHGSTEAEENVIYAYHFMIPSHLCGVLIGVKGATVRQIRAATKCEIDLVTSSYESRKTSSKKSNPEPQICILQGTRSGIERCLELIKDKFPADQYPEFSLKQINEPNPSDLIAASQEGLVVTLPPGQVTHVVLSAIVHTAHIFIQLLENPTYAHLPRLEQCMFNVYEKLPQVPTVPKPAIDSGLVCVFKDQDKYYRVQVVEFDVENGCCEVKFLDYGGFARVQTGDLIQIRQDFLNLPFQAVECYLSNVIPPLDCAEWPFESIVQLEELTRGKSISCREIGVSEESVPIVQLYTTDDKLETRLINKELVDIGAAQWIEHQ